MELELSGGTLRIRLSRWEKFLAVRRDDVEIPISGIQSVELMPKLKWKRWGIRFPGTYFPGLVKSGAYWSGSGWEFWHVFRNQPCLEIVGNLSSAK
jgi:hypothetical protein